MNKNFVLEKLQKPSEKAETNKKERKASTSPSDNAAGDSVTDSALSVNSNQHSGDPKFDDSNGGQTEAKYKTED